MLKYNKNNIPLAKNLRKNLTEQESKLWYQFLRSYKIRFQRQKAIDNYIADFYCAKARLVIEIDGGGHYDELQMEKDKIRTLKLNQMNLQIIRFTNNDIDKRFDRVCQYIDYIVGKSLPQSKS